MLKPAVVKIKKNQSFFSHLFDKDAENWDNNSASLPDNKLIV